MPTTIPTKEEIQIDLDATNKDIARLDAIVENIAAFMNDSLGEDRSFCRVDLLKYQSLASEARDLKTRIETALNNATK